VASNDNFFVVPPEISAITGVVDTYARWKHARGGPRGFEIYHPSAFGKCLRLMQYLRYEQRGLLKSKPEDIGSKLVRLFDKGHNMHERWTRYFEEIGVLRGVWQCTNPMCGFFNDRDVDGISNPSLKSNVNFDISTVAPPRRFGRDQKIGCFKPKECCCGNRDFKYQEIAVKDKDLNLYGHADMILDFSEFDKEMFLGTSLAFDVDHLPKTPVVIDMKTMNDYRFQQLMRKGPGLDYRIQLVIYANVLDLDYGVLIYENKNNSILATYKIDKDTDLIFSQIKQQAETMNNMTDLKLLPPPRPAEKDDYECSHCSFKSICHNSKIWDDPDLHKKRKNFYGTLL